MPSFKKIPGIHVIQTHVTDFDEALDLLLKRQRLKGRARPRKTLRAELGGAAKRQRTIPITLSDRVVPASIRRNRVTTPKLPPVIWSKKQVIEAYKSGWFKPHELASHAKVTSLQIKIWVHGPNWTPESWRCKACKRTNWVPYREPQYHCPNCGKHWSHGLLK